MSEGPGPERSSPTVVRSARPGAPRLVLGHGVTDSAASLAAAQRRWAAAFDVTAVDARGHGTSPAFSTGQLEDPVGAMVEDLIDLLEPEDDGRPVVLVGHSMGGAVAAATAARRPDLVTAVIVEDPAWLTDAQASSYREGASELVARMQQIAADPGRALAENREAYPHWELEDSCAWLQGKMQVDLAFLARGEVAPRDPWQEIARSLTVPTLLITADGPDRLIGDEHVAALDRIANPNLRRTPVAHAGHCVRRDHAAAFHAACEDFLDEVLA